MLHLVLVPLSLVAYGTQEGDPGKDPGWRLEMSPRVFKFRLIEVSSIQKEILPLTFQ